MAGKTTTRGRRRESRARPTGVATGRVAGAPKPGPEHKRLDVFIGKWMTAGETVASGYDPASKNYRVTFFDSQGNQTSHTLTPHDGKWIWQGEHTRCTGVFSNANRLMTAHHERSDDGVRWLPSMTVTLSKVE
ncbi:MAG TPA: hypothetical protein VFH14_11880 [Gemmatimonadaceae bacterium]|nr:hypothetical protein [Gemmatimonadaceae bacterium]